MTDLTHSKHRNKQADGIIIHSMGEYVGDMYAPEFLESIGLSAHFFVTPTGAVLHGINHNRIAFHAGKSKWNDQENLNNTFIGIEILVEGKHNYTSFLEAIKNPDTFEIQQYESTAKICRDLMEIYPNITKGRILPHSAVSGKEVRIDPKQDPGEGFEFSKLLELI